MQTEQISHMVARTKMFWQPKSKRQIQLKHLNYEHLKNIEKSIEKLNIKQLNGYLLEDWKKAIKNEILYRDKMINNIFKKFKNSENLII